MKYTHFDERGNFVNMVEWDGKAPYAVKGSLVPHESSHDVFWPQELPAVTSPVVVTLTVPAPVVAPFSPILLPVKPTLTVKPLTFWQKIIVWFQYLGF